MENEEDLDIQIRKFKHLARAETSEKVKLFLTIFLGIFLSFLAIVWVDGSVKRKELYTKDLEQTVISMKQAIGQYEIFMNNMKNNTIVEITESNDCYNYDDLLDYGNIDIRTTLYKDIVLGDILKLMLDNNISEEDLQKRLKSTNDYVKLIFGCRLNFNIYQLIKISDAIGGRLEVHIYPK